MPKPPASRRARSISDIVAGSSFTNAKTQVGIGPLTQSIDQNFSIGSVMDTGSALDLMVNGNGFFTVTNPENGQVLYTRNGNFHTDGTGGRSPTPMATICRSGL
jgi:flagellar hook protein FlgE